MRLLLLAGLAAAAAACTQETPAPPEAAKPAETANAQPGLPVAMRRTAPTAAAAVEASICAQTALSYTTAGWNAITAAANSAVCFAETGGFLGR